MLNLTRIARVDPSNCTVTGPGDVIACPVFWKGVGTLFTLLVIVLLCARCRPPAGAREREEETATTGLLGQSGPTTETDAGAEV
jgi:hypothetical protein